MSQRARKERERWEVVVAEDNDDHALLIQMALERAAGVPVDVRRARNGEETITLLEESPPDLLLLDLKMPGMAGHEVLERVKGDEELRKIPVAVLTSSDRDEDVARSYGLGGNHFITKPESPGELEQRLRALLKNLSELSSIRRGSEGLPATAVTALDPDSMAFHTVIRWVALAAILVLLFVFAVLSGAIL
ncbi:MAG: hypothetical protein BMS9Abin29_2231 [Gemmatimonadota bacterium]|nr:MAG: hypothetical protein BMS9Abin29_2231 [Gemmatimonadota bacterium]